MYGRAASEPSQCASVGPFGRMGSIPRSRSAATTSTVTASTRRLAAATTALEEIRQLRPSCPKDSSAPVG